MLQVGTLPTDKVPLPSAQSPPVEVHVAPGPVNALTVKGTEPAGVPVVVVMVKVAVLLVSADAKESELGEKDADAPEGSVVLTHKLAVKAPAEPPPDPRFTVIR